MSSVPSVSVEELDAEHEECVEALNMLVKERSVAALEKVRQVYSAHFKHEEDLLDEHLYAADLSEATQQGGFSLSLQTRKSHMDDHARMLANLNCASISDDLIRSIMQDFQNHAEIYDTAYAEKLSAKLRGE